MIGMYCNNLDDIPIFIWIYSLSEMIRWKDIYGSCLWNPAAPYTNMDYFNPNFGK